VPGTWPIEFDTTGMRRHDERIWFDPLTGDQVSLTVVESVPDLPAPLDDVATLRERLTLDTASTGSLIEAHVVELDSVPAVFQLLKLPIPDQEHGLAFIAAFTLPKAECSVVLRVQCTESQPTGMREAMVIGNVGVENAFPPHPYAPTVRGVLPFNIADDARWDEQFPDHPLTRAREWARRTMASARTASAFAELPPFRPAAEPADALRTVLLGLPVGEYLPLWHEDTVTFWRMSEPDAVRERIGFGVESRAEVDTRRYREAALLDEERHTLFLADGEARRGPGFPLTPASEAAAFAAAGDQALSQLWAWLGEVVLAAAERGEFVAVEAGGWHVPITPVVLMTLRPDGEEWQSVVETSPVPVGAPVWRDQQPVAGDTQLLASPATEQTLRAAGLLTRFAVATWDVHPLRLGLSFGPNPTLDAERTR
jgi:hypothetical protein